MRFLPTPPKTLTSLHIQKPLFSFTQNPQRDSHFTPRATHPSYTFTSHITTPQTLSFSPNLLSPQQNYISKHFSHASKIALKCTSVHLRNSPKLHLRSPLKQSQTAPSFTFKTTSKYTSKTAPNCTSIHLQNNSKITPLPHLHNHSVLLQSSPISPSSPTKPVTTQLPLFPPKPIQSSAAVGVLHERLCHHLHLCRSSTQTQATPNLSFLLLCRDHRLKVKLCRCFPWFSQPQYELR